MPRRAGPTRSDRIQEAARIEFAEHGYAGARVQKIADRARVNKQLLFYYFSSKAGLYRSVMEGDAGDVCAPSMTADLEGRATRRLRAELEQIHTDLVDQPHIARLLLLDAAEGGPAREIAEKVAASLARRVSATISDGQGTGYFRDECDAESMARHAISLVLGHLALEAVWDSGPADLSRAESLDGTCELLLRSLVW
jgi:TetR/AcrR family transcriptional regulator